LALRRLRVLLRRRLRVLLKRRRRIVLLRRRIVLWMWDCSRMLGGFFVGLLQFLDRLLQLFNFSGTLFSSFFSLFLLLRLRMPHCFLQSIQTDSHSGQTIAMFNDWTLHAIQASLGCNELFIDFVEFCVRGEMKRLSK
jgi:hypothetical protein